MRAELEYNARSIPPSDIARSFIPPEPHFSRLLARNHTLILGPRGSGKTSLLKMLTLRALNNWDHPSAESLSSQIEFNAAFVSADITWGRQLDSLGSLSFDQHRKEAAFVLHTIRALIGAMRDATELARQSLKNHLRHLGTDLSVAQESDFVKLVSDALAVVPKINSLLGLEIALETKLDSINVGEDASAYKVESFPTKLSSVIAAFNGVAGQDRRWALLFDEMEIAPTWIKSFLLSGMRSFDERIIVKLAIAPYMDDAGFERTPTSPQQYHDYQTIQLSYANKDDAKHFTNELFEQTLGRMSIDGTHLPRLLGSPRTRIQTRAHLEPRPKLPVEFSELYEKDDSFAQYVDERGLRSPKYVFKEANVAQDIRKVLPIVTARNFYIRKFENGRLIAERSRKSPVLYTGFPSLVEITEGNPRAVLTCVVPLARSHIESSGSNPTATISVQAQTESVRRVELLLTSLLRVIPIDNLSGFEHGKGLLDFIDQIGRAFEDRLIKHRFATDYVGTFMLDAGVSDAVEAAVGKALNAGALIHIPHPDSGPDILLRGLRGQRFRISYALASRYRLLLTLGDRVNLSKLLFEMRGVQLHDVQHQLFEDKND
ncbi:hypothetical protein YH63_007180 [Afipia massiliensis]|uniref:Uncharacterized protein n=1 Tax=Afipia massiliensis TaxID=211460 RepID=A0A4U6BLW9_9BRAD|nr:hypothetical protein [Afipia massiliensis]TKT71207.1 hypothetical protein YH63_007180 [Afipia massiliensis]